MTNTKSTFVRKIKRMSRKVPVRIVALVLAVLLVMNVTSILTNLSVFAQTQEDYAVIGIEMNGKTSVVEYRAKDDCSLVVAVYDDDGAKMLGSGNTTVAASKQSAEVEISIDEMPQYYLVKAFLVNPANNYPLCDVCVNEDYTEENNQVTLSNLQSDEEYFVCGKDNVITFTVNVSGNPDSVQLYKNDTELVGQMHDDGLNGDETAGDGKYSFVVNDNINSSDTVTCEYFASAGNKQSNEKNIYFFPEITTENLPKVKEDFLSVNQKIIRTENQYKDENGCVSEDDVETILSELNNYFDKCIKNGILLCYQSSDKSVYLKFTSGLSLVYSPTTSLDVNENGDNTKISVTVCQPSLDVQDSDLYSLSNQLAKKFPNEIDSTINTYSGSSVTLSTVNSFKNNQIIIWNGHGGYNSNVKSYLVTGQTMEWSSLQGNILEDYAHNAVFLTPVSENESLQSVCITSKYIYTHCKNLSNSLFLFTSCHSTQTHELANAFRDRGAAAVVGFTDTVYSIYSQGVIKELLKDMQKINSKSRKYYTLGESLELAKDVLGSDDHQWRMNLGVINLISQPKSSIARPELIGNRDYRIDGEFSMKNGTLSGKISDSSSNDFTLSGMIIDVYKGNELYTTLTSEMGGTFSISLQEGDYFIRVHESDGHISSLTDFYLDYETEFSIKQDETTFLDIKMEINKNKCGEAVAWLFDQQTGTLSIYGNGDTYNYDSEKDVPWHSIRNEISHVSFEGGITSLGNRLFMNCVYLKEIILPSSVTSFGESLFYGCQMIQSIRIPSSVKTISKDLFNQCTGLKSVSIPIGVTEIGENAFRNCTSLNNITLPLTIEKIQKNAFRDCRITSIIIPDSVTLIGSGAFYECKNLKSVTIGNSVQKMEPWCFGYTGLTSVTIPNSVTSLGYNTFYGSSSLSQVTIPESVTTIGDYSFQYCNNLQKIIVSNGNQCFASKDGVLFNKDFTKLISYPGKKGGTYYIPSTVTTIGVGAFELCYSITGIIIPESVTTISYHGFYMAQYIKNVYYEGTEDEWKSISIAGGNDQLNSAKKTFNYGKEEASSTSPDSNGTNQNTSHMHTVVGIQTSTFNNLTPNANYLFVVSKSSDLDNMIDASNLLFIDEKTAGDSGSLTFGYIPREDYEGAVVKIFGPVNPSVTLNNTSATLKKGEKLTLTAAVDQGHSANDVVWSSSNQKIATVSKGQVTAVGFGDAEISAKLDDCTVKCVVSVVPDLDFTILGASIRLSEPYGIRFGIQLGKGGDYTNVKIVEYGTLMKPTQLLGDEELTLQTAKIQKIPSTVTYSETDAALVYTGVLINIPTTYFDTAISGRGYFIYEDENGVNHTIYTDTVPMSFNDVVEAAYNKYSKLTNPTDAQKVVLQKLEKLRALNGNN